MSQDIEEAERGERKKREWLFLATVLGALMVGRALEHHVDWVAVAAIQAGVVVSGRVIGAVLDGDRLRGQAWLKEGGIWILLSGSLYGMYWTFDVWLS